MKRAKELDAKLMQRVNIFFLVKLGWSQKDTIEALQTVYGMECLSVSRIRSWHNSFCDGCTTIVDLHRRSKDKSGRSPANIAAVRTLIEGDRRLTVRNICQRLAFLKEWCTKS